MGKGSTPQAPKPTAPASTFSPFGTNIYEGQPGQEGYKNVVTLSPREQQLYEGRADVQQALLGRADRGLTGMPTSFAFDGARDPATNQRFTAAQELIDKTFDRDEDRLLQRLNNQGLPMGGEAYNEQLDNFRTTKAGATRQAAAEALDKGFGESLATRQQMINEIMAALSAGGVGGAQQIGGVDPGTALAANEAQAQRQYQGQLAGYNADVATGNTAMTGAAAIAAAYI